jgi:hypothetical protein
VKKTGSDEVEEGDKDIDDDDNDNDPLHGRKE